MMMKCFGLFCTLALFITIDNYGQNQTLIGMNGKPLETTLDATIKGSPYLTATWCDGSLILSSGNKVSHLKLRYNCHLDRLEYQMNGGVLYVEGDQVKSFVLINCSKSLQPAMLFESGIKIPANINIKGFNMILHNGSKKLIKSSRKVVAEAADASFNAGAKEKRYALHERYFLMDESQNINEIKLNKKSIISSLGLKKEALNKLIKDHKINLKNETGLVKLLSLL